MMLLALLLTALGMTDVTRLWRVIGGPAWAVPMAVGLTTSAFGIWAFGYGWSGWWLMLVAATILAGWLEIAKRPPWAADIGLAMPTAAALLALGFGHQIPTKTPGLLEWYDGLALTALEGVPFEKFVLAAGCLIFLHTSANLVVRRVLAEAGPHVLATENALKGGRILGPIERWFVFTMALSGQFVAIGAIVAAKGIVRFPEISRDDADGNKAEYVLVGSFASWFLALVFVPLF